MKLSSSNIKKLLIFSQRKAFLLFRETENPPQNISFSGNGTFLFFRELLIFQKVLFRAGKIKTPALKNSLHFGKLNFLVSNIKRLVIFQEKTCKV